MIRGTRGWLVTNLPIGVFFLRCFDVSGASWGRSKGFCGVSEKLRVITLDSEGIVVECCRHRCMARMEGGTRSLWTMVQLIVRKRILNEYKKTYLRLETHLHLEPPMVRCPCLPRFVPFPSLSPLTCCHNLLIEPSRNQMLVIVNKKEKKRTYWHRGT